MKELSDIVAKLLAALLLIAAALKGWQLLTEPVANNDIWSYRPFLIFTVVFELALGLWLLSDLVKKAAWLIALLCFATFAAITLYKGLTGAASCGCFGKIHVNPWITLLTIDLPAVLALLIFHPQLSLNLHHPSIKHLLRELITPMPAKHHFAAAASLCLIILVGATAILALNTPAAVTSSYEVLEPETWVGRKLPILDHIDIGKQLEKGNWLILLYHYDCPDCAEAIPKYEQMARNLAGNEDFLRIALIEVPPYGQAPITQKTPCTVGRLAETKEWFITTPAVALLTDAKVAAAWEAKAPDFEAVLQKLSENGDLQANTAYSSANH